MLAKNLIEIINNKGFDWSFTHRSGDKSWSVGEKRFVKNYENVYYFLTIDANHRIIYDTYDWCHYEEVGRYKTDEELLMALSNILNKVEIVLFARIDGRCTYHKITSVLDDYMEAMETAKANLEKQGYRVLAVEFYSLKQIEPILYDGTFDHNDIISCINNVYDFLLKEYQDRTPFDASNKNLAGSRGSIRYKIDFERIIGLYNNGYYRDGSRGMDIIKIGIKSGRIGRLFASMYILPYPSDEEEYAVSPKLLETIREKLDYQFKYHFG